MTCRNMRSSLGWIDPRAFRFPLGWRKLSSVNHCVDSHRADNLEKPFQQKNKNIQCAANLGSEISHDQVQGCLEDQSRRLAITAFFSATACLERSTAPAQHLRGSRFVVVSLLEFSVSLLFLVETERDVSLRSLDSP